MNNIALIGFMGSGKTTIGRYLACLLNYNFIDTDMQIEEQTGMSINEIFEQYGEKYFRKLEANVVKEVSSLNNTVISTGGGVVLTPKNIYNLKSSSVLIYLRADLDTIYKNLSKDNNNRPLLNNRYNLKERIVSLFKEREDAYVCADIDIDVNGKDVKEIAQDIIKKIEERK